MNYKKLKPQDENNVDKEPVRGSRSLSDIHRSYNIAALKSSGYKEATTNAKWIDAMKDEIKMTIRIKHRSWWLDLNTRNLSDQSGFIDSSLMLMIL